MPQPKNLHERAARLARQDGIARLALLALSERDVQRLLQGAAERVADTLAVDHAELSELLPGGHTLLGRAAAGEPKSLGRTRLGRSHTLASYALLQCEPVVAHDLGRETRFQPSRSQRVRGIASAAGVPLYSRNGPYGVLEVGSRGHRLFAPEETDFLQAAGSLIVPAIERARAEAACRFMAEFSGPLVSSLDYARTVTALADLAVPRLADWCCVDVIGPDGAIVTSALAHADRAKAARSKALRRRLPPDPGAEFGIAGVVRNGVPEVHSDLGSALSVGAGHADAVARLAEAAGFRTAVVAPLTGRGLTFGAVTLVAERAGRVFDAGDLILAEAFAAQAASVLDDVRLVGGPAGAAPDGRAGPGIQLLADCGVARTRLLASAAAESERLARVVENVVLVCELEAERRSATGDDCDAVAEARSVVEDVRGRLPDGCTVELEDASAVVAADAGTVRRLLGSLLDNAAKYSPEGGAIRVRLESRRTSLLITVSDEGLGVPSGERRRIFRKFYRAERDRAAGADGAGVGLYICRELVKRVNGRIGILPSNGTGATFFVELPLARGSRKAGARGRKT